MTILIITININNNHTTTNNNNDNNNSRRARETAAMRRGCVTSGLRPKQPQSPEPENPTTLSPKSLKA